MLTKFLYPLSDIQNTARTLLSSGIPVGTPAHADAGSANDSSNYWTVTLNYGGSHYGMTRVSDAINDRAANCFIAKNYNGYYGAATQSTDQFC